MDGYNELNCDSSIELQKYNTLVQMDCCCFFEYDIEKDSLSFSNNFVLPELSGKVIEHFTFQASSIIANEDVQTFVDFLHFGKEFPVEFQIKGYVQKVIWCQAKGKTVYDSDGKAEAFIGYVQNIDDKKREEKEKSDKLGLDELTGTYNQAALKERISYVLRNSDMEDTYVFLIMEICQFDKLIEHFGEVFGDVVLTNIASKLKLTVSGGDLLGRIGNDKFLIFMKNPDVAKLETKIHAIIDLVKDTYTGEDDAMELYGCIGSACFPGDGTSYAELFRKADIALYDAKQQGDESWVRFERYKLTVPQKCQGRLFLNDYDMAGLEGHIISDIDMEMVNFTLDLMGKTKDVGSAVNILLDKIGRSFCVNDVMVVEREAESQKASPNYLWNVKRGIGWNQFSSGFPEKLLAVLDKGKVEDEIQCLTNIKALGADFAASQEIKEKDIQSILLCGFYDKDILKGCICMDVCGKKRVWKKQEVDSFVFIARIVAFYLLKLRESERITEKMQMVKNYDMLTGLPTLNKFRIDSKIIYDSHPDVKFVVGYMDINNFKYINDTLGYEKGDELLKDLAAFLNRESIPMQVNARTSADNFITFIPFTNTSSLKDGILKSIEKFLMEQKKKNISYNIGISIGLYIMKENETDFMAVIDNANTARKLVKNSRMGMYQFYDEKMEREIMKERMILGSMGAALEGHEFKVYLQPKISLENSCIVGAEALVRWIREDGIILPPNDFIPLFEKNGFVIKLDFYIYEEVCKLLKRWREEEKPIVPISVNVSRVHLYQMDFIEKVLELTSRYEIEPWMIEFELTESIFLDNTVSAITVMKELRNHGFCVSIDDFGAGYSSLNLLKDMRTDVLKLDKEFFREGDMKKEEQIIVSSIISMAKQLNMKVLSEGVETQKQSEFLKQVDCDMAQGYLYAKPLPIADFESMLLSCIGK